MLGLSRKGINKVRIIGGAWRRRLLQFPAAPGLRPTPDRVRETLFNWLGQDLSGKTCLDLFAGSGALGFEAASRYASQVTMVENHPAALRALQENQKTLAANTVTLVGGDALHFLRSDVATYDVVFLDPPYSSNHLSQALPLLPPHLSHNGLVYLESGAAFELPPGWEIWRQDKAGKVRYQLVKWAA